MPRRPIAQDRVLTYLRTFGPVQGSEPVAIIAAGLSVSTKYVQNAMRRLVHEKGAVEMAYEGRRVVGVGLPGTLHMVLPDPPPPTEPAVNHRALADALLAATIEAQKAAEEALAAADTSEELARLRVEVAQLRGRHTSETYLRDQIASLESQLGVEREKARTANARCEVLQDRLDGAQRLINDARTNHRSPASRPLRRPSGRLSTEDQELLVALQGGRKEAA